MLVFRRKLALGNRLGSLSLVKSLLLGFSRPNSVQLRARGQPYFRSLLGSNSPKIVSKSGDNTLVPIACLE
jgi:hypothetical protein